MGTKHMLPCILLTRAGAKVTKKHYGICIRGGTSAGVHSIQSLPSGLPFSCGVSSFSTHSCWAQKLRSCSNNTNMDNFTRDNEVMMRDSLQICQRFDGLSVPPVCAVKPLLDCRCQPCHCAANRASARFFKEHRDVQDAIRLQENNHLQAVMGTTKTSAQHKMQRTTSSQ